MPTASKTLFEKIADAQADLGDLPRDRTVNTGRYTYSYVTEDAITKAIRQILAAKGVATLVSWIDAVREENMTTVRGEITFADATDKFTVGIMGTGSDTSDKGLSKAQTSALRIGLCKIMLQAGDDDNESTSEPREPRRVVTPAPVAAQSAEPVWSQRLRVANTAPGMTPMLVAEMLKDKDGNPVDAQILDNDLAWTRLQELIAEHQERVATEANSPSEVIKTRVGK